MTKKMANGMTNELKQRLSGYIAYTALVAWGQGWRKLSVEQRQATLALVAYEFLSGRVWADEADRCRPSDVTMDVFDDIMNGFKDYSKEFLIKDLAVAPKDGLSRQFSLVE